MVHSSKVSEQPHYFKPLFNLLEITPEFKLEALQTLQQKEIELGIKIPNALKECFCYFDTRSIKEDPSILYNYDDHNPNSPSITRRLQALYGINWDLHHFIEKDAKKEEQDKDIESILMFWTDIHGTGSYFIGLDGSENPPIYEYMIEYVNENDYEWLIRVSNHFSDFIIESFLEETSFRNKIICATIEPFTLTQIDFLKPLFPHFIKRDLVNFEDFRNMPGFDNPSHSYLMYSNLQVLSLTKVKKLKGITYTWKLRAKNEDLLTDLVDKVININPNLASCLKK